MSKGHVCRCPERKKPLKEKAWRVLQFCCNHSRFNGSRRTSSEWSQLCCAECGALWRTRSNYVGRLYALHGEVSILDIRLKGIGGVSG